MKIAVIGAGYVGLVTSVCLAETANDVVCMDIDHEKIDALQQLRLPLYEPHLEKMFLRAVEKKHLRFVNTLSMALAHAELIFLALPTPNGGDGHTDLRYVLSTAREIGCCMDGYKIIINKSTVPVGTAEQVRIAIKENYSGEFDVASNPEFLREGSAVMDFMKPDRIIIGTAVDKVKEKLTLLYEPYVQQGNPILVMDEKSAELTKYAANSFLATKISFMNEMSQLAEKVGANIDFVRKGMGADPRIGNAFLYAGVGYGGSCFPKDVKSLIYQQQQAGSPSKIVQAVDETNQVQRELFFTKIKNYFEDNLNGKHFAMWGLAFKPNTDDIREAPALACIDFLLQHGASVTAFDPEAMEHVKRKYDNQLQYANDPEEAIAGVDGLIIMTEWREFASPNFEKLRANMKRCVIFDGRNIFSTKHMSEKPFDYISIGRNPIFNAQQQ